MKKIWTIILLLNLCSFSQADDNARQLMSERRYSAALERLQSLDAERRHSAAIQLLIGRCHLKLEQYALAEQFFERVLARPEADVPLVDEARHLRWSVWLLRGDAGARGRIETEIETLLNKRGEDPYAVNTAYEGYGYLWQREKQSVMVQNLAEKAVNHPLRHRAAGLLYEEAIAQRDKAMRREMLRLYLTHYPHGREIYAASRSFVFAALSPDSGDEQLIGELQAVLGLYPENPHLLQHAAMLAVAREAGLEKARAWLQRYQEMTQRADKTRAELFRTPASWQQRFRRERAEADYLLGVIELEEEQLDSAKTRFQRVLAEFPEHGRSHYRLAQLALARAQPDTAMQHFRQALKLNAPFADGEEKLRELLARHEAAEIDPAVFFARRDGIVRFENATKQLGLDGISSGRVAWGDFNNDGFADLLLDGPRIFENNAGKGFSEVTQLLGLSALKGHNGGLWADYDNDGDLDLLLTRNRQDIHLYRNDNSERFVDVSEPVFTEVASGPIEAAAWGDMDNDGDLDLYLANYETGVAGRANCGRDYLYENHNGRLLPVNRQAGVITDEALCGRGVLWSDINRDGRQDILVVNYRMDPNQLWLNQGNAQFSDAAAAFAVRGMNKDGNYGQTIGAVVADFDNDLDSDLFIANLAHPRYLDWSDLSAVMRQEEEARLVDYFLTSGIRFEETNADPAVADVDNDGDLDLYISSIYRDRESHLYLNDGDGVFTDVTWESGAGVENAWGVAFADYDRDGDQDLLAASRDGVQLLENKADLSGHHWLSIHLHDTQCNRFGVGARVTIEYAGHAQTRELFAGRGTGSQDALQAHFGLGDYAGEVTLTAANLCGQLVRRTVDKPDRIIHLRIPQPQALYEKKQPADPALVF